MIRTANSLSLVALLAFAPSASAQKPPRSGEALTVHPEAAAAIAGLWSPYCPGLMLKVCTSSGGAMLRDSIQAWAESGMLADDIIDRVVAEYGEEYRAEPKPSGTGLLAWLLPPLGLAGGLLVVGVVLVRRRRLGPSPVPSTPPSAEDETRIRAALKELDEEEEPDF